MTCHNCRSECQKHGKDRKGNQRFKCAACSKTFLEPRDKPLDGMYLPMDKAETILKMLVEGCSIRSIERLTDVHRDTIMRLLVLAGERCEKLMGRTIVNVKVTDVQCDEIWGFVSKKEKHKRPAEQHNETIGDQYCFVAIERHSKLVLNIALGRRDKATTDVFIEGLRQATAPNRFQVTTDGFQPYVKAISDTLADRVSFAQLIKVYRTPQEDEKRYSPAEVASVEVVPVMGNPDPERICTSHIERQNLTMRMQIRRLTRLTNAFSKKWENLWAALCLHFAWYNFVRVHRTLRVTPAMQAGVTDRLWTLLDLITQ
jgi:transposase-like protein/IS1 family transposase